MATEYPLTVDTSEGLTFVFKYRQKQGGASLIPEGSTARMVIRDSAGVAQAVELTTESGHITLDPATGQAATVMPRVEAEALVFRDGTYKWYLHRPDGTRKKLFVGPLRKI
jgi:hypothetical protein